MPNAKNSEWIDRWIDSVAAGANTMSQRKLTSIEKHGGLKTAKIAAENKGVHLLRVEDDRGVELIAASLKPFEVIC